MRTLLFAILGPALFLAAEPCLAGPDAAAIKAEREALKLSEAEKAIYGKLSGQKVTLNLADSNLAEAVAFLREISGLNFVVHPEVDGDDLKFSLKLKDIRLYDALFHLVRGLGLGAVVRDEAIFIGSVGDLETSDTILAWQVLDEFEQQGGAVQQEIVGKLEGQKLSLNFNGTELTDVLAFLHDISGVNYTLSDGARERNVEEAIQISLQVKDVKTNSALNLMLAGHELTHRVVHGAVVVMTAEEAREMALADGEEAEIRALCQRADPPATRLAETKQLHRWEANVLSWGAKGPVAQVRTLPLLTGDVAVLAVLSEPSPAPAPKVGFK